MESVNPTLVRDPNYLMKLISLNNNSISPSELLKKVNDVCPGAVRNENDLFSILWKWCETGFVKYENRTYSITKLALDTIRDVKLPKSFNDYLEKNKITA